MGGILRQLRAGAGLTLEEVGAVTGYRAAMVCRIERGKRKISTSKLVKLLRYYGFDADGIGEVVSALADEPAEK